MNDNINGDKDLKTAQDKGVDLQRLVMPDQCCKPTPQEELYRKIMDCTLPKNEAEWWAKERIEELQDFIIWMTGCGYDFSQHDYFCKKRDKLLKA